MLIQSGWLTVGNNCCLNRIVLFVDLDLRQRTFIFYMWQQTEFQPCPLSVCFFKCLCFFCVIDPYFSMPTNFDWQLSCVCLGWGQVHPGRSTHCRPLLPGSAVFKGLDFRLWKRQLCHPALFMLTLFTPPKMQTLFSQQAWISHLYSGQEAWHGGEGPEGEIEASEFKADTPRRFI